MSTEWESSEVMSEFLKVAAESGLISTDLNHEDGIGNPTKDTPVKDHTRNEPTKEYGIKTEPADMIDKAHPEQAWMNKNSTPVPSMGNGSLVENVKEQQKKDIEIAIRMPHGTLIGVHANLISELVKLANSLDSNGKTKEAARIDEAIKKISACSFVDGRLHKEAAVWFLPLLMSTKFWLLLGGGAGGIKMFGQYFTSKQENLRIDLDDLYEKLIEHGERSKSATKAAQLLSPFRSKLASMDLSSKEGSDKYAAIINELGAILVQIKQLIAASRQDIGERSGFFSKMWGTVKDLFGFEDYKILDEKFNDFMKSYNEARKYLDKAKDIEAKVLGDAGGLEKATSFKTILDTGFMGKKYDTLEELEIALNAALKNLYESGKIKKSFTADIISDGKPTSTPNQLREVLDIVEKKLSS
jgi:hypothetical protein